MTNISRCDKRTDIRSITCAESLCSCFPECTCSEQERVQWRIDSSWWVKQTRRAESMLAEGSGKLLSAGDLWPTAHLSRCDSSPTAWRIMAYWSYRKDVHVPLHWIQNKIFLENKQYCVFHQTGGELIAYWWRIWASGEVLKMLVDWLVNRKMYWQPFW